MKTAISIPDELFEKAERLAKERGMSRSELYTTAIRHMVKQIDGEEITRKVNEICAKYDTRLDPGLKRAQAKTLEPEEW